MSGFELRKKPNGIWFIEFLDADGHRRRISTKLRDRAEAGKKAPDLYYRHIKGEEDGHRVGAEAAGLTVKDALDRLLKTDWRRDEVKSYRNIESDVRIISQDLGDTAVTEINYTLLEDYVLTMRERGLMPGTIRNRMMRLSKMLDRCTKWINPDTGEAYLSARPPMPSVRVNNTRDYEVTTEQERRLYELCDEIGQETGRVHEWWVFKQFLICLIDTGMRKGEALRFSLDDVENDVVTLVDTKNGDTRVVPLTTRSRKYVEICRQQGIRGPLFGGTFKVSRVHDYWQRLRQRAGLDEHRIHDFRHTYCCRKSRQGMPLEKLALLVGHRDPSITFKRYIHLQPKDLQNTAERFDEYAGQDGKPGLSVVS